MSSCSQDPRHPNVLSQTIQNVLHGRMQPFPSSMSPGCRALIMGLLQCNPKQRTTLHIRQDKNLYDSVICHPSFRKLRCHLKARLCFLLTLTLCIKCKAWEHQSLGASECKWKLWLHLLHHSGLCPRPGKVTVAAVPSPSIWQSGTYVFADVKDVGRVDLLEPLISLSETIKKDAEKQAAAKEPGKEGHQATADSHVCATAGPVEEYKKTQCKPGPSAIPYDMKQLLRQQCDSSKSGTFFAA
eukprot:scaffold46425_cov16-Tisochrysis_lutea.AAC.1